MLSWDCYTTDKKVNKTRASSSRCVHYIKAHKPQALLRAQLYTRWKHKSWEKPHPNVYTGILRHWIPVLVLDLYTHGHSSVDKIELENGVMRAVHTL